MENPPLQFERKNGEEHLKHLGFLLASTKLSSACLSKLHEFLKEHSGPLGPIYVSLEGRLVALVSPFYKEEHKPLYNLLLFADDQVEKVTIILDEHGPHFLKTILHLFLWGFKTIEELCYETIKGGINGAIIYSEKKLEEVVKKILHNLLPFLESTEGDTFVVVEDKSKTSPKSVGSDTPAGEGISKKDPEFAGGDIAAGEGISKTL